MFLLFTIPSSTKIKIINIIFQSYWSILRIIFNTFYFNLLEFKNFLIHTKIFNNTQKKNKFDNK